jgi:hypothetical protein
VLGSPSEAYVARGPSELEMSCVTSLSVASKEAPLCRGSILRGK